MSVPWYPLCPPPHFIATPRSVSKIALPHVRPLADFGGLTSTHWLTASPARNFAWAFGSAGGTSWYHCVDRSVFGSLVPGPTPLCFAVAIDAS